MPEKSNRWGVHPCSIDGCGQPPGRRPMSLPLRPEALLGRSVGGASPTPDVCTIPGCDGVVHRGDGARCTISGPSSSMILSPRSAPTVDLAFLRFVDFPDPALGRLLQASSRGPALDVGDPMADAIGIRSWPRRRNGRRSHSFCTLRNY